MTAFEILLAMISSEVCGKPMQDELLQNLTDDNLSELYSVSKNYDMAHLAGSAIKKIGRDFDPSLTAPFYNEHAVSVFRYRRFVDEIRQISDLFEDGGIEHIVLKGSVLRNYYPEPWMRTSCDIDILVKPDSLDSARSLLEQRLGYKYVVATSHDLSLQSQTGVHLELHFTLLEDYKSLDRSSEVLAGAWDRSVKAEGKEYARLMSDEDFYFYHVAHMAKHFLAGGCGIKPFVDLWILENRFEFDKERRDSLIQKGGLTAFLEASRKLISVWFFGAQYDENTRAFERYLLLGGTYGTVENSTGVRVAKKKGKLSYAISRIFPSYASMKNMYPTLKKRKILLPFYHIKRWCRIIFRGGTKRAKAEFKKSGSLTKGDITEFSLLLEYLELDSSSTGAKKH